MEYDEADFQHDEDNDGYADEYPEVIDITMSQTTCQGALPAWKWPAWAWPI